MKLPPLPPSVLALQSPAVRAQLARAKAPKAAAPVVPMVAVDPDGTVRVTLLNLELPSLANERLHWRAMYELKLAQQRAVYRRRKSDGLPFGALAAVRPPTPPLDVTVTRVAPRPIKDDDNAVGCAKFVRDSVSRWLGVDDSDPSVAYVVEQETGSIAVRVVVRRRDG